MDKSLKIIAIITLIIFLFQLTMFTVTDDLVYGVWAILLAIVMRIRVTVDPKEDERK